MKVAELSLGEIQGCLDSGGLDLQVGLYTFRLVARGMGKVATSLSVLYADYETKSVSDDGFIDFHVSVETLRKFYFIKKAQFFFDGFPPFNALPYRHAPAIIEWGLNWCISSQINTYLIIHAAVIEKSGYAVVMPAPPGSGKSTLTAALIQEGWRLLSDELTLIDLDTRLIIPFPRPVSLKNQSIDVIKQRYPHVVFGPLSSDTVKGSVCHIKPPSTSVAQQRLSCPVGWIIFPKYEAEAKTELIVKEKAQTFLDMADNSFNYSCLGEEGFNVLAGVVDGADCYQFRYSELSEAIHEFNSLCIQK